MVCVTALQGRGQWQGSVRVYSDNTMDSLEVRVTEPPLSLLASPSLLDLGPTVLGTHSSRPLTLTNPSPPLLQWRAVPPPAPFSLPLSSGLLNPGTSVTVAVHYLPSNPGPHSVTLGLQASPLQGGEDGGAVVAVTLSGEGLAGAVLARWAGGYFICWPLNSIPYCDYGFHCT